MSTQDAIEHALAQHRAGSLGAAVAGYEAVLGSDPSHVDALHMLGVARLQMGQPDKAAELIGRAIELQPDLVAAQVNLAAALLALGRREAALAALDRALAFEPRLAGVQLNRANLLMELGRHEEALSAFDAAIETEPDRMEVHNDRGAALLAMGWLDAALVSFERAVALRPDAAAPLSNRAAVLNELERPEEAAASCRQAIQRDPHHAGARHNLGTALLKLDRPDAALERFAEALARDPGMADAEIGRGLALYALRRPAEAMACFDASIALRPSAEAHFGRAKARLALGDLQGGFDDLNWRWRLRRSSQRLPELGCPLWRGEDPAGKSILIHCEQGFGDSLQFVRYAGLLAERGAKVTLRADASLVRLFQSIPAINVVTSYDPAAFDLHVPMMDLPLGFGTTLATIPATSPYLAAQFADIAHWKARITDEGRALRVGLVWAGKSRVHDPAAFATDRRRSMSLAQFAPLGAVPGVRCFSLQKGPPAGEAASAPPGLRLVDHTTELRDFADTAALIEALDLVISVDTSVAHLAGALGKPVWVLSRFDGCWRWLNGREDSPWYPSARIFHQARPGDWAEVIRRVTRELGSLSASRR